MFSLGDEIKGNTNIFSCDLCIFKKFSATHRNYFCSKKKKLSFMRKNSPENLIKQFEIH